MRKIQTLGLLALTLAVFTDQSVVAEEVDGTEAAETSEATDYSQQLPAFVNQVSVWKPHTNASYAYTDLDQNGMLEVLTSYTSKKGEVTNGLWELQDGYLTECVLPWGEDEEQTELKEQKVPVYYDSVEDIYYYLFGTVTDEEIDENVETEDESATEESTETDEETQITVIWLKDGELNAEFLTEDVEDRFEGMDEYTVTLGWISTAEHTLKDAPLEQLSELGSDSISQFSLKKAE